MAERLTQAERDALLPPLGEAGWGADPETDSIRKIWKFRSFSEAWGFMARVALLARWRPAISPAGGGPGGGMFGRGRQGGRLQFSLTHMLNLVDEVTIRPGLPKLDYLRGDAAVSGGGRARHEVEAEAGYFNNGLGARLSANWRSGTRVESGFGQDLRFSPLSTFDLRLFANLGERLDLVTRHPFLRGASVRIEVDNLFNSRPRVRSEVGDVPFSYQSDLLSPVGRTVSISFRKLFLPRPQFIRRGPGQQGTQRQ